MSLYDLVSLKKSLKENLDNSQAVVAVEELRARANSILTQVPVMTAEDRQQVQDLVSYYSNVIKELNAPIIEIKKKIDAIDDEIYHLTQKLFSNNYELETRYGSVESVRNNRRIHISGDVEQMLQQKIKAHTNWQYASLEIGCRDGEWTQYMVAADPLYILDRHEEFLDSTVSRFNSEYQRRLRKYQLKDNDLSMLPQGQFGFIFSWGYFNYISMDTLKLYLKQIFGLLRDGGTVFFSYNDGDTTAGAGMAENFAQTYVPKSLLMPLAESMGYQVVDAPDINSNTSWIELRKPGHLSTVKAHQVLGEIKRIGF